MDNTETILRERLQTLQPTQLDIIDESHLHAGHSGRGSAGNFRLLIVSPQFAGKTTLQCQRLVYAAVGDLMVEAIHSLSITTRAA